MVIRREGGNGARVCLIIFTLILWIAGITILCIGIWMLLDPKRSYILDLVNFSEDDPLLIFASYTCIVTGICTLFVGFMACCGAMKRLRCMLTSLIFAMFLLFLAGVGIAVLGLVYRDKFPTEERMEIYIQNMTKNRYSRDAWVLPLMDAIQFYQHCCGGYGPRDYQLSFWFITNHQRGTRSFVPYSCCRQTQSARAWDIHAVEPLCNLYHYDAMPAESTVYQEGCGAKLYKWFNEQTVIFAAVGFSFAALQVVGIIIAVCLCNQVRYYHYVRNDIY